MQPDIELDTVIGSETHISCYPVAHHPNQQLNPNNLVPVYKTYSPAKALKNPNPTAWAQANLNQQQKPTDIDTKGIVFIYSNPDKDTINRSALFF
jgi:hypothetical protein